MTTWYAEQAWLGIADGLAERVLITTERDRITEVLVGVPPSPEATRLPGLVIPGLVNAHSHAFHRALRGRTHDGRGDFWTWRDQMYAVAARLDPDTYRSLAAATYAEMVLAGITTVVEFHYLHHAPDGKPYADPNAMGHALHQAARDAGIRLILLDTCYLQADVDGAPLSGPQRRFGDGDVDQWAGRAADGPANGYAIHSVRACSPADMAVVADAARRRQAPLHIHLSEQQKENQACLAVYGRTPTEVCADAGILGERTTAVHATHLQAGDIQRLGETRTTCCFCPTTERELADGVGPATALIRAGSPLALGSDSHAVVDAFEEARAVELNERLVTERRGHHSADALLHAATGGGARSAGLDAGRIAPGATADLTAVRLDSVRLAGHGDPVAAVVFAATASDVTDVVVAGEHVVAGGHHHRIADVPAALTTAIRAVT